VQFPVYFIPLLSWVLSFSRMFQWKATRSAVPPGFRSTSPAWTPRSYAGRRWSLYLAQQVSCCSPTAAATCRRRTRRDCRRRPGRTLPDRAGTTFGRGIKRVKFFLTIVCLHLWRTTVGLVLVDVDGGTSVVNLTSKSIDAPALSLSTSTLHRLERSIRFTFHFAGAENNRLVSLGLAQSFH